MTYSETSPGDQHATGLNSKALKGRYNLLALHQQFPARYPFLLESVAHASNNPSNSRFDILFAFPGSTLVLDQDLRLSGIEPLNGNDFLHNLDQWWQSEQKPDCKIDGLPFCGGWFLFLAYELAQQIEPRLDLPRSEIPVACATRIPAAIIYDHQTDTTHCLSETGTEQLQQLLSDCRQATEVKLSDRQILIEPEEEDPATYLHAIERVKRYIIEGDVFQVNLSRLWQIENADLSAVDIYSRLRKTNPAPFAGLASWPDFSVISSSPERLVCTHDARVETRPIAGTRRREINTAEDESLKNELIAHPKERAEHIMLIDLERNDLGRICQPGTIQVDELMVLESYAHVHHIVSNVRGRLHDRITPGEVIRALFPGGTITGCPKLRCMEIIAELEQAPRGAYTGSMGYLNHNGDMDINILIRTITLNNNKLSFRAGAGLVADSVPEHELRETRHKARGLLLALQ